MKTDGVKIQKEDRKQASNIIAGMSIVGLTTCVVSAAFMKVDLPIFLYAIFGGGILGTENILKILKTVFRVGSDDK